MIGIVAGPAVAEPDVEETVRSEREMAAVVVGERLPDDRQPGAPAQIETGRGIGDEPIVRAAPEARDDRVARAIGEVDERARARGIGREDEPEQSLLPARDDRAAKIEKIGVTHHAVAQDADAAALLEHELHRAIDGVLDDRHRVRESGRVDAQAERRLSHDQPEGDAAQHEHRDRSTGAHPAIIVSGCRV
jgi:hypothetical protein